VVIAVMAIMIGLVGFSFSGSGGGQLGQGQRLILSLLQQVKTLALSTGKECRLIVNSDLNDEVKSLRYIEIVVQGDQEDSNNSGSWEIYGNGVYLPENVWFVTEDLKPEEGPVDGYCKWSASEEESSFQLSYPVSGYRLADGQDMRDFLYISCNSTGRFQTSTSLQLVISSGNLRQMDGQLRPFFPNPKILAGVLIQPFGGIFSLGADDFVNEN